MGPLAQNPSQSAAWLKPACDWATFGKFGGSRQSSVEFALGWPQNRLSVVELCLGFCSEFFHPGTSVNRLCTLFV
eukprot:COSAG01_NODE_7928_length_2988_cov_102.404292_2_plen_75_part_00